jgi:flagellar hook-length control protein FliK
VGPQKTAESAVIGLVPKLGTRSAVQSTSAKIIGDGKLLLSEADKSQSPTPSYLDPNVKVKGLAGLRGVLPSEITTVDKSGTSDLETLGAVLEHIDQPAAPVDKVDGGYTTAKNPGLTRSIAGASQGAIVLDVPLNDQRWGEAFASRVVWQVGEKIQQAQVRINPPDLGPIEVRISVERDQASVQFTTQHGLVREAIEDALPRLREMLSQSGLHLADANVSQQSAGNEHQGSEYFHSEDPQFIEETDVSAYGDAIGSSQPTLHRGLIDTYA